MLWRSGDGMRKNPLKPDVFFCRVPISLCQATGRMLLGVGVLDKGTATLLGRFNKLPHVPEQEFNRIDLCC